MKSASPATTSKPGRPAVRNSRNAAEVPVMDERVTARTHLASMAKWVNELHDKFGFTYQTIGELTWRGKASYGYWQSVATRQHMTDRPKVRPCMQDYHDVEVAVKTARLFGAMNAALFAAAMDVTRARAGLDGAVGRFLEVARKRTGK